MSEQLDQSEQPDQPKQPKSTAEKLKTAMQVTAAAAGLVAVVAAGVEGLDRWRHPESDIVGGVPAQVEGRGWTRYCGGLASGVCTGYRYSYWLQMEQCPEDVEAARRGEQTTSFNPAVGTINEGCEVDRVAVSAETYSTVPDGTTLVFTGTPDDHLRS